MTQCLKTRTKEGRREEREKKKMKGLHESYRKIDADTQFNGHVPKVSMQPLFHSHQPLNVGWLVSI